MTVKTTIGIDNSMTQTQEVASLKQATRKSSLQGQQLLMMMSIIAFIVKIPIVVNAADINSATFAGCSAEHKPFDQPRNNQNSNTQSFVQGLHVVSSNLPGATVQSNGNLAVRNIVCAHFDNRTAGGTVVIPWAQFDRGQGYPGGRYDWNFIESQIEPWDARGQKVNLLVWPAVQKESQKFPNSQSATPNFIMTQSDITFQCPSGSAQGTGTSGNLPLPKFWDGRVKNPYRTAIRALTRRYENDARINYFRFGIGVGAESYPANGATTPTNFCRNFFVELFNGNANVAYNTWKNYVLETLRVFRRMNSKKFIVVTINDFRLDSALDINDFPDAVADQATRDFEGTPPMGLGVQGATTLDRNRWLAKPTRQRCNANWCAIFQRHRAKGIPLQLQTPTHSGVNGRPGPDNSIAGCQDPNKNVGSLGCMKTGNMATLIRFGRNRGVNSWELYPYEWHVANDMNFQFYARFGKSYRTALDLAKDGSRYF